MIAIKISLVILNHEKVVSHVFIIELDNWIIVNGT
jgi:hypothetical protein